MDPIIPYILAATFIGTAIGFIGATLIAAAKRRRVEMETWKAARLFYTRAKS